MDAIHATIPSNQEKNMSALIRYLFFGCVALALSACGSSGSSTLLDPTTSMEEESGSADQKSYPDVEYLITDIPAAIAKFATEDTSDEGSEATPVTGAVVPAGTAAQLATHRNNIVLISSRYLSTGTVLAQTKGGSVESAHSGATCTDGTGTGPAKCVFAMDDLRSEMTTYHLGLGSATDENEARVSFRDFVADREPVMDYRETFMSQVRTEPSEDGDEEYVGYDGMLTYSMFFVGVHRFFDTEGGLQHARFEHASLGRIYDEDSVETGIQTPTVALTGEGVMVGMEKQKSGLESHLVQGDVNIMYDPLVAADPNANPPIEEAAAMIDVTITNIQRLADAGTAWYADSPRQAQLAWKDVTVTDSKFEDSSDGAGPTTRKLQGSIYGTNDDPEVGGVFYHEDILYEIIGSFGSKLSAPPTP